MHPVDEFIPVREAVLVREAQILRNDLLQSTFKAFNSWLARQRSKRALRNEFAEVGSDEVAAIARDVGIAPSQFRTIVRAGPGAEDLLNRMLDALGLDPTVLRTMDVCTARDLQSVCSACASKRQCRRSIAAGTAAAKFREFCPNSATLGALTA